MRRSSQPKTRRCSKYKSRRKKHDKFHSLKKFNKEALNRDILGRFCEHRAAVERDFQ